MKLLFSKKLSKTDVQNRMAVPMKQYREVFLIPEGDFSAEVPVIDMEDDSVKKFNCTKRHRGHEKPVFDKGWIDFVKEKQLVEDDEVIFNEEKGETSGIRFKVQAKRTECKLFGVDLRNEIRRSTYSKQQN